MATLCCRPVVAGCRFGDGWLLLFDGSGFLSREPGTVSSLFGLWKRGIERRELIVFPVADLSVVGHTLWLPSVSVQTDIGSSCFQVLSLDEP